MPPTTTATSATAASFTGQHNDNHRLPSKRKLDDYAPSLDDDDDEDSDFSDLVSVRMRRDESLAVHSSSNGQNNQNGNGASNINQSPDNLDNSRVSNANSSSSASSQYRACSSSSSSSSPLQFFVRMMGDGRSLVIQANSADTVKSLHERIFMITRIPVIEQRLVYKGKQLQWEQSLAACSIENDSGLHLVGRMRSTRHPRTCQLVNDMVSFIYKLCKGVVCHPYASKHIKELMNLFFTLTPKDDNDDAFGHLQVFTSISAPAALVALYVSTTKGNKDIAESSIKHFFDSCRISLPKPLHTYCAPIVLEFCKLLRKIADDDPLYICCRGALGSLLENAGTSRPKYCYGVGGEDVKGLIFMQEIFPFVAELASRLSKDLVSSLESPVNVGPPLRDVRDFSAFLLPLHASITDLVGCQGPFSMPFGQSDFSHPLYEEEIRQLYAIFNDLLDKMDKCLEKMEDSLPSKLNGEIEPACIGWSNYLAILKALSIIAKMYKDGDHKFLTVLKLRKASVHALIMRYTRRTEDHQWLLQHKEVTNFESRRHLAMMMFPEVKEDYEELHEMLIDRSQLLAESFEYIAHAEAEALHGGLFMEFKNEEATGPGVLREWFLLVAQAIFDPHKALFVACPNDRRRFFPNPTSKVDPLHLEYFTFSGRLIALALMHKVQVGIVLDRVFFLQLAGMHVSLEDIRDADPFMYSSCRQILEMDAAFIDSDALGLTFVREVEELGSRKVVELCTGGKRLVVNSENRERYVDLLIRHCFVTSISEQISHFARGFGDILCNSGLQSFFFQSLELEDLDWMLYGSVSVICIEDWKAHTEYTGYKETDPQISWFWTIVGGMSAEQKKNLLFFWTSVRYLPVEGFRGLASRLHIYRSTEPQNRLPSSHTCFYRLCFPPYASMAIMQDRLRVITQEHIGSSFGTW